MNSRSLPVALAVAVLLAGCVAPVPSVESGATASDEATTIDVSGTGHASAAADLALVFVAVTARADTADGARSAVARDVGRMRSALRDAGIPDDAVTTTSFRISPRYEEEERTPRLVGYDAVHAFRIETSPDRAGEIIDLTVGNGADRIDGVRFTLRDETHAQLRQQALTRAVEAARADADTTAAAANLSITGVRRVSTSGGVPPVFDARVGEAAGSGGETILDPGPVSVEVTVSVTYTAE